MAHPFPMADPMPRKIVLVLGGCGYIGQFVIQEFLGQSCPPFSVHMTYHRTEPSDLMRASVVSCQQLDIGDPVGASKVLDKVRPDVVINCAGVACVGQCEQEPAGTEHINCPGGFVEILGGRTPEDRILFVHFSTDLVFAGDPSLVYDESSPPLPVNAYGRMKASFDTFLMEQQSLDNISDSASGVVPPEVLTVCEGTGLDPQLFLNCAGVSRPAHCVVLRLSNVLGPLKPYGIGEGGGGGGSKFLQWLDRRLCLNEVTTFFQDELRCYIWVTDVAELVGRLACLWCARERNPCPLPHLLHCGGPQALSRVELAEMVLKAKHYAPRFQDCSGELVEKIVRSSRADADLGYNTPFDADLGYNTPLCIHFDASKAEKILGRSFSPINYCLRNCDKF